MEGDKIVDNDNWVTVANKIVFTKRAFVCKDTASHSLQFC